MAGSWVRSGKVMRARASRGIQMIVPEVHVDRVARRGVGPPQFPGREADAVEMLRLRPETLRIGVGEDEDAVVAVDHTALAARVARQPRVARGMDVAGHDPAARLEAWRSAAVREPEPAALRQHLLDVRGPEDALARRPAAGPARLDLFPCEQTPLDQEQPEAVEPLFVIARREVLRGRHPLAGVARHVDVPLFERAGGEVEGEHEIGRESWREREMTSV